MIKESLIRAYNFSKEKHEGQIRKFSGLPYFTHPKGVARIIEHLTGDETMVVTAFLHDILEDTQTSEEEIRTQFGDDVLNLVRELTSNSSDIRKFGKASHLFNKMVQLSDRALIIKLADRLHNVQYLEEDGVDPHFVEKYWKETLHILTPVAIKTYENKIIKALYDRILAVLQFLEIRYKLYDKD